MVGEGGATIVPMSVDQRAGFCSQHALEDRRRRGKLCLELLLLRFNLTLQALVRLPSKDHAEQCSGGSDAARQRRDPLSR